MDRVTGILIVLGWTAAAFAGACFVAFGLWFAPGWANGWPLGLHRNVIWPAGLSLVSFAVALTACAGAGCAASVALGQRTKFWPPTGWYRVWLLVCVPVAAAMAWGVFGVLRTQAVGLWP